MNKAAQINTLRRIRRQCPYLATEGGLGYMCDRGNTTSNGHRRHRPPADETALYPVMPRHSA